MRSHLNNILITLILVVLLGVFGCSSSDTEEAEDLQSPAEGSEVTTAPVESVESIAIYEGRFDAVFVDGSKMEVPFAMLIRPDGSLEGSWDKEDQHPAGQPGDVFYTWADFSGTMSAHGGFSGEGSGEQVTTMQDGSGSNTTMDFVMEASIEDDLIVGKFIYEGGETSFEAWKVD